MLRPSGISKVAGTNGQCNFICKGSLSVSHVMLGGKSLTNGCDCASFILVYKEYGYNWKMGSVNTLYDSTVVHVSR